MATKRYNQVILIIVLLGLVCYSYMSTGTDADTLLENTIEKQASVGSQDYIETLTFHIGNETRTVEYEVLFKEPNKFRRIERSDAMIRSETVSNGDVVWIYDPEKNTVLIRNLESSEKIPEPAIYALLTANISEKFIIEDQRIESLNSIPVYKVKLTPHELDTENTREYLLWIDSDNLIPLKLQSLNKGNPLLTLEYREYWANYIINDDEFTFVIPDGASVVYV